MREQVSREIEQEPGVSILCFYTDVPTHLCGVHT
jgi:hypothetical protein